MYCLIHQLACTVNVPDVYYVENNPWVMNYWNPRDYFLAHPSGWESNWWQQDFAQWYQRPDHYPADWNFSEVNKIDVKNHYTVAPAQP